MYTTSSLPSILDGIAGFDSQRVERPVPVATPEPSEHPAHTHRPLERGSSAAATLYEILSGTRVVTLDSPPGGGKTSALTTLLSHLANRFGNDFAEIVVGTPTRAQALSLYDRLLEFVHVNQAKLSVKGLKGRAPGPDDPPLKDLLETGRRTVTIRTIASLKMLKETGGNSGAGRRLLVVDEAYQATFADVAAAANSFDQVVLVGDPGQIGPVITVDTGAWEKLRRAPHRRAPEAFQTMDFTKRLTMDRSYRLGPQTVAAIAPLYDFPFSSGRPERHLLAPDGSLLPEVGALQHAGAAHSMDPAMLARIVDRVRALVGSTAVDTDRDGTTTSTSVVGQEDVAVVVALNTQVTMLTAMLAAADLGDVTVGTADKLQGGEWRAVVALDPLAGGSASAHHLALGRLCVMASRHTTHLTWVHDDAWEAALDDVKEESPVIARTSRKVRRALTATPLQG